ncbi:hypothetical protein E1B28_002795 [Marasmius oreades]|uniref:FHA domain-containing protein n=1 Tax=Marasmius oreades TaxID=181124 RepID=A0A9P7RPE0_9AGAR|nr:uncharacterized protein E1B28_002795 [Marasmius oreades]KAG7086875.1 hypothetical protein E1B28_002795 [Marasmius oreades]
MSIIPPPFLSLQPISGSFPFQAKFIPIQGNMRVVLGSQVDPQHRSRRAAPTNGYFAPIPSSTTGAAIVPLSLDSRHAEAWISNNMLYIRDLGTGYGTFVNGARLEGPYALKRGDILKLGVEIPRNANTPPYIADEELKPILARISFSGVSN